MTQLVQLQQVAEELTAHGFGLFAISNDPVEVLDEFARAEALYAGARASERAREHVRARGDRMRCPHIHEARMQVSPCKGAQS